MTDANSFSQPQPCRVQHEQHEQVISVSFKWVMKFLESGREILNFVQQFS